jgi:hypothetical protein
MVNAEIPACRAIPAGARACVGLGGGSIATAGSHPAPVRACA